MRFLFKLSALFLIIFAFHAGRVLADFAQIRSLLESGDFVAALRQSEQDLKANPRDYKIWTLKGIALQGLNRSAESLTAFRRALALEPEFLPALEGAAQLEYQTHDPKLKQTLGTILKVRPETATAHAMLGVLAFEGKNCVEAIAHFEAAGADATANPLVKSQLGTCYYELEKWNEAESQFRALLEIKDDAEIRYNLGLVQMKANKPAVAVATLQPLAAAEKPEADVLSLLAAAYEANKQVAEAVRVLQRGLEIYPREERLYADLATICLENDSYPLGMEILEIAAKNIPDSARINTMLGIMYASAGFAEKGQEAFKKAESLAPKASHARVGLAISLMQSGAAEQAVRLLRDSAAKTPDDLLVLFTLAEALLQKGDQPQQLQEAKTLLQRVVKKQLQNARAFSMLGKIYFREQDIPNAVRALESAVSLDATDRAAAYQLMTLYNRAGRKTEAEALRQKVEKLVNTDRTSESKTERYNLIRIEKKNKDE